MISIDVRFDDRALRLQIDKLHDAQVTAATVRALNRTVVTVRASSAREIRAALALPIAAIKKRLSATRATRSTLTAIIKARDYDPSLMRFSPRWRRGQAVGASVATTGGRQTIPGAFTGPTTYGRLAVYRRVGRARKPIQFLRASDIGLPTLGKAFMDGRVQAALRVIARARFAQVYEQEVRFRASRNAEG